MNTKINLLVIATNKYTRFLQPLLSSADKYFLPNQDVSYSVFTDHEQIGLNISRPFSLLKVPHKPWPSSTLLRYSFFKEYENQLVSSDYLYYCDADMLFVDYVDTEILSDRVATLHPAFRGDRGTPETNPISTACIMPTENMSYFAGGFNGGSSIEFLKMCDKISTNIEKDLQNGYIAIWHDESHLNRYFLDNPPTKILDPGYCYPESWGLPFSKKLLALDKNHEEMRS